MSACATSVGRRPMGINRKPPSAKITKRDRDICDCAVRWTPSRDDLRNNTGIAKDAYVDGRLPAKSKAMVEKELALSVAA